ncbi:hypothetical protein TcasGA2_TC032150 [Tribolium castaneum]|uniref:Spaetzle domain-containing protein n=1 Tax=Tribolium castaneum TaxID=7070 RepID=A0A139WMS9_TRICA|nr:hypothetical protein TcasGA2_TC032150 [Tribolium castaneum]
MHLKFLLLLTCFFGLTCVKSQSFTRYRNRNFHNPNPQKNCSYNICEHIPNYPENVIKETVKGNKAFHSYFGDVVGPAKDVTLSDRSGGASYEPFCKTTVVTKIPRIMKDVDNIERVIVNVDGYRQVIKFQTCSFSNGGKCYGAGLLTRSTSCVQKFNIIKLVTINIDNNDLEYRKFQIPTACVCAYSD